MLVLVLVLRCAAWHGRGQRGWSACGSVPGATVGDTRFRGKVVLVQGGGQQSEQCRVESSRGAGTCL